MAGKEELPTNDVDYAAYLDGVAWADAHTSPEVAHQDRQATEIANRPEPDQGLFHRN